MPLQILLPVAVAIASALYLGGGIVSGEPAIPVTSARADDALNRLRDWATWFAALQTAAIGAMGLGARGLSHSPASDWAAAVALTGLGGAVVADAWLLASLPSVAMRLVDEKSKDNDIFAQKIFSHVEIRVGRMFALMLMLFALGIIGFAAFVWRMLHAVPAVPAALTGL